MKTIASLKYPADRINGYVQLTDGTGNLYVPDHATSGDIIGDAMKYAGAFLALAHRIERREAGDGE